MNQHQKEIAARDTFLPALGKVRGINSLSKSCLVIANKASWAVSGAVLKRIKSTLFAMGTTCRFFSSLAVKHLCLFGEIPLHLFSFCKRNCLQSDTGTSEKALTQVVERQMGLGEVVKVRGASALRLLPHLSVPKHHT